MKKPRNKKYRGPRDPGAMKLSTQLYKVNQVFDPLEAIIDQLEEQGTVDATPSGKPIFKDTGDGHWYESPIAILGVVDAYQIHQERKGIDLGMEPLRKLAKKLEYNMPIFEQDTKACRDSLVRMKRETLNMTADYARQLIVDFQIKEEFQKIAA